MKTLSVDDRLATFGYTRKDTNRGEQVKQSMWCRKHRLSFVGYPHISAGNGVGCPKCDLTKALEYKTPPGFVFTKEIAEALMTKKRRYAQHSLLSYSGSMGTPSTFRCSLTGKKFQSTVAKETKLGRTGCLHCAGLTEKNKKHAISLRVRERHRRKFLLAAKLGRIQPSLRCLPGEPIKCAIVTSFV